MSTEVLRSREENQNSLAILNMVTFPSRLIFVGIFQNSLYLDLVMQTCM